MIASMGHVGRFPRTKNRGKRSGANIGVTREIWPCADGFVSFGLRGGKARVANMQTITRLVAEDGLGTPALTDRDWTTYDHNKALAEELDAIAAPIAEYFLRHTMAELYEIAVRDQPDARPGQLAAPAHREPAARGPGRSSARSATVAHFPRSFVHVTSPGDASRGPVRPVARRRGRGDRCSGRPAPLARAGGRPAPARRSAPAWTGTRIVEFGTGAAGPIAVRYFAEHGATVVRVESRSRPDFLRTYGIDGNPCGLEGSDMFDSLNVGKLGVTLNLKHPEGVGAWPSVSSQWADAVAENFAPRAMRGFGLDYASMVAEKPDLVMVSSCLQGQTGPHKDYPGFGGQGSALGGYNFLTGWPDREPVGPLRDDHRLARPPLRGQRPGRRPALPAAHRQRRPPRREPGRGGGLLAHPVDRSTTSVNGHVGSRQGNRSDRAVPTAPSRCAGEDRWVAIACWDDDDWAGPGRGHRPRRRDRTRRLATLEARSAAVDEIEKLGRGVDGGAQPGEAAATLQAAGIEAVPVADLGDASADPQLHHRGHFVTLEHPCMGECGYERNGFRLSRRPGRVHAGRAPPWGSTTSYVLGRDPRRRRRRAAPSPRGRGPRVGRHPAPRLRPTGAVK